MFDSFVTPMAYSPPGSSVHGFPGKNLEWVAIRSPGDLRDPGMEPVFPALADRFFTAELARKPLPAYHESKLQKALGR